MSKSIPSLQALACAVIADTLNECKDVLELHLPTSCHVNVALSWLDLLLCNLLKGTPNERDYDSCASWLHKQFWKRESEFLVEEYLLFKLYVPVLTQLGWRPEYWTTTEQKHIKHTSCNAIPNCKLCQGCAFKVWITRSIRSNNAAMRTMIWDVETRYDNVTWSEFVRRYITPNDTWCARCERWPLFGLTRS